MNICTDSIAFDDNLVDVDELAPIGRKTVFVGRFWSC
jgi:hypothetical protein